MKLEYLYTLIEVYNEKSITKAAQKLDLADKTVQKYLNQLEVEIGVQPTVRSTRGITFTEEGHAFYLYANNTIANLDAFKRNLAHNVKDYIIASESKIFISSIIACTGKIIEKFKVKFSFKELYREEILTGLRDKKYDIGLITMDKGIQESLEHYGLQFVPVTKRKAVIIVKDTHPLAYQDEISLVELKMYKRIGFENPFDDYYNYYYDVENQYGLQPGNILLNYLGDMELILQNTESYYYLGGIIEQEARLLNGLKVLRIKEIQDEVEVGYVRNKESDIDDVIQSLIDTVNENINSTK